VYNLKNGKNRSLTPHKNNYGEIKITQLLIQPLPYRWQLRRQRSNQNHARIFSFFFRRNSFSAAIWKMFKFGDKTGKL